jgi:hypothetical protein
MNNNNNNDDLDTSRPKFEDDRYSTQIGKGMNSKDKAKTINKAIEKESTVTIIKVIFGFICIILGILASFYCVNTNFFNISIESGETKVNLLNATPGIVLILGGLWTIFASKIDVKS